MKTRVNIVIEHGYQDDPVGDALAALESAGLTVAVEDMTDDGGDDSAALPDWSECSEPQELDTWARVFGKSERTVRRWLKSGKLTGRRRGQSWAISLDDLKPDKTGHGK